MHHKRIAFGIITHDLLSSSPIIDFLNNAIKYGHTIHELIICYNDQVDNKVVKELTTYCPVHLIRRGEYDLMEKPLFHLGMEHSDVASILETPLNRRYGKVSYGTSRNYVMTTALLNDHDYLFFFDSDVFPKILTEFNKNEGKFEEIDYVGNHLNALNSEDHIVASTSDYTGYYIIPKINFPHLYDLLHGIQKEDQYKRITTNDLPVITPEYGKKVRNTKKILGGNLALNLQNYRFLAPFFSETLVVENECFLGRGEDTLFGPVVESLGGNCIDIDLMIFHNCYGNFPEKPKIDNKNNVSRFYYACMGWLIRNPFYNWVQSEFYSKEFSNDEKEIRYRSILEGSSFAANYFNDKRFLILPETFKMSYDQLDSTVEKFHRLISAWNKFKNLL